MDFDTQAACADKALGVVSTAPSTKSSIVSNFDPFFWAEQARAQQRLQARLQPEKIKCRSGKSNLLYTGFSSLQRVIKWLSHLHLLNLIRFQVRAAASPPPTVNSSSHKSRLCRMNQMRVVGAIIACSHGLRTRPLQALTNISRRSTEKCGRHDPPQF